MLFFRVGVVRVVGAAAGVVAAAVLAMGCASWTGPTDGRSAPANGGGQTVDDQVQHLADEPIAVQFDTSGYEFYEGAAGPIGVPEEAFLQLVAVRGDERLLVDDMETLESLVEIHSAEEALDYVRLLTAPETHYLFPFIRYVEPMEADRGEPGPGEFSADSPHVAELKDAEASRQGADFIIERNLVTEDHELVEVTERVSPQGEYTILEEVEVDARAPVRYPAYE